MSLAEKLAVLRPGGKWRVLYDDRGNETIEWGEASPAPTAQELSAVIIPSPQDIEDRLSEIESRLEALERGR